MKKISAKLPTSGKKRIFFSNVCIFFIVLSVHAAIFPVDNFNYADNQKAATAWRAIAPAPSVQIQPGGGIVFPCPFQQGMDRVYWDRQLSIDLSPYTSFELDLACDAPVALRSLAIYFKSGDGWYIWNKPLREAGRQSVILLKEDFSTEGKPAGWHKIERIRISPWKGTATQAKLVVYSFHARKDSLFLVQASLSSKDSVELNMAARTAQRVSSWLSNVGLSHSLIKEDEVVAGALRGARLAILPYNPDPPPSLLRALRAFLDNGGRLVVCYSSSAELASLMNMQLGNYAQSKDPSHWNALAFKDPASWHVPAKIFQTSWNIRPAFPKEGGEVIAYWANAHGKMLSDPAWTASDKGLWMSHILLDDDHMNKQKMLLGLLAHFDHSLWRQAARQIINSAGKVDNFPNLQSAIAGIQSLAQGSRNEEQIQKMLGKAQTTYHEMIAQYNSGQFAEVIDSESSLQKTLADAYGLAQTPRANEFRGVWDHDGTGWYPGNWNLTCQILANNGINAIFPNMLWAGLAHYPSRVVPTSDTARRYGDQLKQCIAAARKAGLQVHVWKVCWNIENAPQDFIDEMRRQNRLQMDERGKTILWLNPADPRNVALELSALKELAANYDIDGIHLDYVRFPNGQTCYSKTSQKYFEQWSGRSMHNWLGAIRQGGQDKQDFQRWRASLITDFVRTTHAEIKKIKPALKISAAVWGSYPDCVASVGQDWATWLKAGYVDFVCPMNYTTDRAKFASLVQKQLQLPNATGKIFPGIGVTASESQLQSDQVIEQIRMLRKLGATGFMLFDLSHTLREETLPALGAGITKK